MRQSQSFYTFTNFQYNGIIMYLFRIGLLFCLCSLFATAQLHSNDSLIHKLDRVSEVEQLRILEQLSAHFASVGKPDSALHYDSIALAINESRNDLMAQSNVLNNMALSFYAKSDYARAIHLLTQSMILKDKIKDTVEVVKALNNLGALYQLIGDYTKSIEFLSRSLEMRRHQRDTLGMARTMNNISVVYKNLGQTAKSLALLDEAYRIYAALDDTNGLATVHNNKGTVYQLTGEFEAARVHFLKSLSLKDTISDLRSRANTYNNLGMVYAALNDSRRALENYHKALEIRMQMGDALGQARVYLNMGELAITLKQPDAAETHLRKAVEIADGEQQKSILEKAYYSLAKVYAEKRDFESAFSYTNLATAYKDSVYNDQLRAGITELEAQQRTAEMYRENEMLKLDNELKSLRIRRNRTTSILGLFVMLLIIVLSLIIWVRSREKRKLNKQLEQNIKLLHESEEKYKAVAEQSNEAIFIHWGGVILFANAYLRKLTGLTENQIYRKKPEELIYLPDRAAFLHAFCPENAQGEIMRQEFRMQHADGSLFWLDMNQSPVKLHNEFANLVIGRDITEQKSFNEMVRKFEQAVRQSPASIIITNSKGHIEYVNPKFTEVSGYSLDEVKGKTPRILKSGIMDPEIYKDMWETITSGRVWRGELLNRNRKGGLYWEAASISPMIDEHEIITHYIGVKEDITQQKAAQERLRKSEESLRDALKAKDKFFSIIAHDLKNPFNAILGFSSLLLNEYDDFDEQEKKDFIANIHDASASSFKLLQNLLEWSRAQTGSMQFKPEYFDLGELLDEVVALNKSSAINKDIDIQVEVPDNCRVYADANMVLTIMRNLTSNAIKFTGKGGEVQIVCKTLNGMCEISVKDNGIGIPADKLDGLFRIDDQLQRTGTEQEKGTGLGLALCAEFVKKNGGKIRVESEENKGSTFVFTLKKEKNPD